MIPLDRDQFLEDGFVILRNVIPPDKLDSVRKAYEILVERKKEIWARERGPDDPPGGNWEKAAQPRVQLAQLVDRIDAETAPAVDIWLDENTQGVSSKLLGVEDAAVTTMSMMCNPVRDHGTADHRGWHRDFYPPYCAPLQSYAEDIVENGPRYIQWNLPLYDDDVLWVVPGSHIRFNTEEEDMQLNEDSRVPLPDAVQTDLKAGDGVAYILPILHWGSRYDANLRRTIHGGFSLYTYYEDLSFLNRLSEKTRNSFERWDRRSRKMVDRAESVLRAALSKDAATYHSALDELHPGRGDKGKRQSTVYLSKAAKRIAQLKDPDFDKLSDQERGWATSMHPITLHWGRKIADRFSAEEAKELWRRFKPVDDAFQAAEEQWSPGFQGGPTRYNFNEAPDDLTVESFVAGWESR
jgi:hypothetical protein